MRPPQAARYRSWSRKIAVRVPAGARVDSLYLRKEETKNIR